MALTYKPTAGASFETVKPGPYKLTLIEVEESEQAKFGEPDKMETRWIWKWQIDPDRHPKTVMDNGQPLELRKWTSTASGPRSASRPIIQALLRRELTTGEEIDIEALYGRPVLGVVAYQKDPSGQIKKNDDGTPARNVIDNFLPWEEDDDEDAPKRPVGAAAVKEAF